VRRGWGRDLIRVALLGTVVTGLPAAMAGGACYRDHIRAYYYAYRLSTAEYEYPRSRWINKLVEIGPTASPACRMAYRRSTDQWNKEQAARALRWCAGFRALHELIVEGGTGHVFDGDGGFKSAPGAAAEEVFIEELREVCESHLFLDGLEFKELDPSPPPNELKEFRRDKLARQYRLGNYGADVTYVWTRTRTVTYIVGGREMPCVSTYRTSETPVETPRRVKAIRWGPWQRREAFVTILVKDASGVTGRYVLEPSIRKPPAISSQPAPLPAGR